MRFQPYLTSYDQVICVSWPRLPLRSRSSVKCLSSPRHGLSRFHTMVALAVLESTLSNAGSALAMVRLPSPTLGIVLIQLTSAPGP